MTKSRCNCRAIYYTGLERVMTKSRCNFRTIYLPTIHVQLGPALQTLPGAPTPRNSLVLNNHDGGFRGGLEPEAAVSQPLPVPLDPPEVDEGVNGAVHYQAQLPGHVPGVVLHEEGGVEGTRPAVQDTRHIPQDVVDEVGDVEHDVAEGVQDYGYCGAGFEPVLGGLDLAAVVHLVH